MGWWAGLSYRVHMQRLKLCLRQLELKFEFFSYSTLAFSFEFIPQSTFNPLYPRYTVLLCNARGEAPPQGGVCSCFPFYYIIQDYTRIKPEAELPPFVRTADLCDEYLSTSTRASK